MSETEKTVDQALSDLLDAIEASPEYRQLTALYAQMEQDADLRALEDEERQAQEQLDKDASTPRERAALVRLARARESLSAHPLRVQARALERALENQLKPLAEVLDKLPGKRLYELFGGQEGGER